MIRHAAWVFAAVVVLSVATAARADLRTQTVEYRDGATVLHGYLAYDDATEARRPGVLVCPEWWGVTQYPKDVAEKLAKLGYVAFVADYYGMGKTTVDPQEAARLSAPFMADRKLFRERGRKAFDFLAGDKHVDPARIAAIGYCFGGAAALELARDGVPLVGVVTFHGSLGRTPTEGPDHFAPGLKVLICQGGADPLVPPQQLATCDQELKQEGVDHQIDIFSGAKHAFTNPAADSYHIPQIGYDPEAARRSWVAAKDFLGEVFGQG